MRNASVKKGLKQVLLLMTFQYTRTIVTFCVTLILANTLSKDQFGMVGVGTALAVMIGTFVKFGSEKTLVRDLRQNNAPEEVFTASLVVRVGLGALSCLALIFWIVLGNRDFTHFIIFFVLYGITVCFSGKGWFDSRYEMSVHAVIGAVEKISYFLVILLSICFFETSFDLAIVVAALLITRISAVVLEWYFLFKTFSFNFFALRGNISKMWKGGVFTYIATIANTASPYFNQLVLGVSAGVGILAGYFLAFQMVVAVQLLQQISLRILSPVIAVWTRTPVSPGFVSKKMWQCLAGVVIANCILLVPLIFFTPWIFQNLLPKDYSSSVLLFQLLCLSVLFFALNNFVSQFLICLRNDKGYLKFTIFRGLLAVIFGYILIAQYNAVGAALSVLCVRIMSTFILLVSVHRTISKIKGDQSSYVVL